MVILPFLLGASLAASPLPTAPPAQIQVRQVPSRPALWVVNDHDTIIYLFGTFHALDGKSNWFGQSVKTAFSASDQLLLETIVPAPPGLPLRLGRGTHAAPGIGQSQSPMARLAPSASVLATTKLVMDAGRSKGLSIAFGADAVLREAADEAGKPVAGLESFEAQLNMFSSLPSQATGAGPSKDPRVDQALGAILAQLQAAWGRGDIDSFAPMLRQMETQSPQMYRTMFVERNARWAHWIADRLQTPGTIFVAVGAGHLSGPDSVQNQLDSLGVRSARVN
ncbi:MAG: TraB/GumN family protein [Sphingomonas sp.]|nr:TraB/GumN family protein [Sphingomonas sp.]